MPGRRSQSEKTVLVQVRLTEAEAAAWRGHVKKCGGYLSALVRDAVNAHVARPPGHDRCSHWG